MHIKVAYSMTNTFVMYMKVYDIFKLIIGHNSVASTMTNISHEIHMKLNIYAFCHIY